MPTEEQTDDSIDLRVLFAMLRRRKWSVLLIAALVLGLVLAYTFHKTPIYSSTAVVEVNPLSSQQEYGGTSLMQYPGSIDSEKSQVKSQTVAEAAAETLGISVARTEDLNWLLKHVSVSSDTNTRFLKITYSDPFPAVAQLGAKAFADAYISARTAHAQAAYQDTRAGPEQQIQDANKQIADLEAQLAHTQEGSSGVANPKRATLQGRIADARATAQAAQYALIAIPTPNPDAALLALPPDVPTSPSSPNVEINVVVGLMLGLGLGVVFASLRERTDARLSGREEFEEAVGAPVLAVVPKIPDWKKRDKAELVTLAKPMSQSAEAYRTIRANLQFIARRDDVRIVGLTSSTLGEGKTTTTANLGVALAQTGKRVIIVSCDLRKPRLHRFFDLENKVGTSSLIAGDATLTEAIQAVPGLDSLRLIASGPIPPNPAEMLGSPRFQKLLKALRGSADFVLLDTPPVSAVSDALVLAPETDAVILVADASKATRQQVEHLRDQLEQVGGNIIGGIFNNFDPATAKYGYYYGGYYHHGDSEGYGKGSSAYHDDKVTADSDGQKKIVSLEDTRVPEDSEGLEDTEQIWT